MQSIAPRPSLQPTTRLAGSGARPPGREMRVPARGSIQPANSVDRAMMHNFDDTGTPLPAAHSQHYTPQKNTHAPTYASSTQALFATQPASTPYEQLYHYDPATGQRRILFPFRAFMIVLVLGAIGFGAFAAYRAFTTPNPVNAEPPTYNAHTDPALAP